MATMLARMPALSNAIEDDGFMGLNSFGCKMFDFAVRPIWTIGLIDYQFNGAGCLKNSVLSTIFENLDIPKDVRIEVVISTYSGGYY